MRDETGVEAPRALDAAAARRASQLALGFGALAGATFALVVLGALVRAHGAGLACPDWPLCFGQVIPELDLRVAFEWSHRVVAGWVALVFAGLALAALRERATRAVAAPWLAAGAVLLALQICLGALTVWLCLAPWTVVAHLVAGNAFAATLLLISVRLARAAAASSRALPALSPGARAFVTLAACAGVAQVVLGGLVSSRYAGLACPAWPSCDGSAFFPSLEGAVGIHLLHRTGAYVLLTLLAGAALSVRRPPVLARALAAAFVLACAQTLVGIANVLLNLPVEVTGLHSALAAALVLTLAFAVHEAWTAQTAAASGRQLEGGARTPEMRSAAPRRA